MSLLFGMTTAFEACREVIIIIAVFVLHPEALVAMFLLANV